MLMYSLLDQSIERESVPTCEFCFIIYCLILHIHIHICRLEKIWCELLSLCHRTIIEKSVQKAKNSYFYSSGIAHTKTAGQYWFYFSLSYTDGVVFTYFLDTMILRYLSFLMLSFVFFGSWFALEATYYSDSFEWWSTANGDIFSQSGHSAAACDIPLGQYGYISRGGTGLVATINDRPNCSRYPDIIDLSRAGFQIFAPTSVWRISDVSLNPIGKNTDSFQKKNLTKNTFASLGVELSTWLSNTYFTWDAILVKWRVLDNKPYALIYLENKKTKKEYSYLVKTDASWYFQSVLTLPDIVGVYYCIIASGNSFSTETPVEIKLVDPSELTYPIIPVATGSLVRPRVSYISWVPVIQLGESVWGQLTIQQWSKSYESHGNIPNFDGNKLAIGSAKVKISGYTLSTPSSLDRSQLLTDIYSGNVTLDRTREAIWAENVTIRSQRNLTLFRFRIKDTSTKIRENYYITYPNGSIEEYHFPKKYIAKDGFLLPGVWIQASFTTNIVGTYKLETVRQNGYAYYNIPIIHGNVWNIIKPLTEWEIATIRSDVTLVTSTTIDRINTLRKSLWKSVIQESPTLQKLATAKARNMADNDYIGHWTPDWLDILGFADSLGIDIEGSIGENVAGGNVSDRALQDGLEESGSHRYNMLDDGWKYVGIGYIVKQGKTYMTQIFWD